MSIYRDEARGTYYVVVRLPRDGQGRQRQIRQASASSRRRRPGLSRSRPSRRQSPVGRSRTTGSPSVTS